MATFGGGGVVKQAAFPGYVTASNEYVSAIYVCTTNSTNTPIGGIPFIMGPINTVPPTITTPIGGGAGSITFTFLYGVVFST